jgi:hypothetical protein
MATKETHSLRPRDDARTIFDVLRDGEKVGEYRVIARDAEKVALPR